jgi:hypothetical protein
MNGWNSNAGIRWRLWKWEIASTQRNVEDTRWEGVRLQWSGHWAIAIAVITGLRLKTELVAGLETQAGLETMQAGLPDHQVLHRKSCSTFTVLYIWWSSGLGV